MRRKILGAMTPLSCISRRRFVGLSAVGLAGGILETLKWGRADAIGAGWNPARPFVMGTRPLRVQPVLMYRLPTPRSQASWKSWGGVQDEAQLADEVARIEGELELLKGRAEFPLVVLPLRKCTDTAGLEGIAANEGEVTLLYACTGSGELLRACLGLKPHTVVFVRRRNGPTYYWFEALSVRYLDTREAGSVVDRTALTCARLTSRMWWWMITKRCFGDCGRCRPSRICVRPGCWRWAVPGGSMPRTLRGWPRNDSGSRSWI